MKPKCVDKDNKLAEKVRYGDQLNQDVKQDSQTLSDMIATLRQFKGITRKKALGELLLIMGENIYDDAGVLKAGNVNIVVSADGIVESLVEDNPWLAGFYSVVVNVNDVVAKGARPLGYAYIVSSNSSSTRRQIVKGIKEGIDKYGLTFLKAHTHPDTSYNAVDGAVVGITNNVLSSAAAKPDDSLIAALDLDGNFGLRSWVKTFDSIMFKTKEEVQIRIEAMIELAEKKSATACRDISGPGIVGTIGIMCESSRVGAFVDLDSMPKPENVAIQDWLMTYPSTGFVLTSDKPRECMNLLREHGFDANEIGRVTEERTVRISYQNEVETYVNLERESFFALPANKTAKAEAETLVLQLSENDASDIRTLLKKVWSNAYEYPEEWRNKRILTRKQISKEMKQGYHYFGVRVDSKLVGVYKALVTDEGLLGEHQSVDPDHRGLGLATNMYHQFVKFAKKHNCKKVYVNALVNQPSTTKILVQLGFQKKGREYEQEKGMKVQMYEKTV